MMFSVHSFIHSFILLTTTVNLLRADTAANNRSSCMSLCGIQGSECSTPCYNANNATSVTVRCVLNCNNGLRACNQACANKYPAPAGSSRQQRCVTGGNCE